jgi:hypothetical protein
MNSARPVFIAVVSSLPASWPSRRTSLGIAATLSDASTS